MMNVRRATLRIEFDDGSIAEYDVTVEQVDVEMRFDYQYEHILDGSMLPFRSGPTRADIRFRGVLHQARYNTSRSAPREPSAIEPPPKTTIAAPKNRRRRLPP